MTGLLVGLILAYNFVCIHLHTTQNKQEDGSGCLLSVKAGVSASLEVEWWRPKNAVFERGFWVSNKAPTKDYCMTSCPTMAC